MTSLGKRLVALREARGLKQKDVAEALKIAPNTLSRYESDERVPDLQMLTQLAEYYGVSVDYLATGRTETGEQVPWWERERFPEGVDLEKLIQEEQNIRLMGDPLNKESKDEVLFFLRMAHEHMRRSSKI